MLAITAAVAVLDLSCEATLGGRSSFAREAGIEGTVVLDVWVGKSGRVENLMVVQGVTGLNDAAVDAAKRWVFKPAKKDHEPMEAWYEISFDFSLP